MHLPLCDNLEINRENRLLFGGTDAISLAEKFGTPLYVMDGEKLRENLRAYRDACREYFAPGSFAIYASKANCFKAIYPLVEEEGLGADVVSLGELATAEAAGFPMEKIFFQSNNKTDEDIRIGMEKGTGTFVVDSEEELEALEREAAIRNKIQSIFLRLTPGIDPHTYAEVATGKVDSKFGFAIETGAARAITEKALACPHLQLKAFHCHVGSMVFAEDVYVRTVEKMLRFMEEIHRDYNFWPEYLDIGGGIGVRYTTEDPEISIKEKCREMAEVLRHWNYPEGCREPKIILEPGRSIVADAGMTLYKVGTVKKIPGYKNYVSVDGGMTDNPRYALYHARYTVLNLSRLGEKESGECFRADLVGRCCESGDILQPDVSFPSDTCRGDVVGVFTTGAYNYSMASNYNRLGRPAMVLLDRGEARIVVRRESIEDLLRLDN